MCTQYQKAIWGDRYRPWSLALYQAAALQLIFGLYCGVSGSALVGCRAASLRNTQKEDILSRAYVMRGILVASLREIGFFQADIAKLQETGATFLPFVAARQEERKR